MRRGEEPTHISLPKKYETNPAKIFQPLAFKTAEQVYLFQVAVHDELTRIRPKAGPNLTTRPCQEKSPKRHGIT